MTVRWGFLGAGWIAQRALAPAVHAAAGARLEAVASRDSDRSRALEPRRVHASYADLLADDEIDVVYVCLANDQHHEWVVRALAAGKHVLCEKPMGLDHAEVTTMGATATAAGRLLVEAVWCRWHPRFQRLALLARQGELGALVSVDSAFTFTADLGRTYRGDPARGGGALLDVGGYQVHAWQAVTGGAAHPGVERVERTVGPTGVDVTTRVAARLAPAARATAVASFVMPEHQYLVVTGTDAVARTGEGAAFTTWREPSTLLVGDRVEEFAAVDAYEVMVASVSDRISGGGGWVVPLADTLAVSSVLDAVRAAP